PCPQRCSSPEEREVTARSSSDATMSRQGGSTHRLLRGARSLDQHAQGSPHTCRVSHPKLPLDGCPNRSERTLHPLQSTAISTHVLAPPTRRELVGSRRPSKTLDERTAAAA